MNVSRTQSRIDLIKAVINPNLNLKAKFSKTQFRVDEPSYNFVGVSFGMERNSQWPLSVRWQVVWKQPMLLVRRWTSLWRVCENRVWLASCVIAWLKVITMRRGQKGSKGWVPLPRRLIAVVDIINPTLQNILVSALAMQVHFLSKVLDTLGLTQPVIILEQ